MEWNLNSILLIIDQDVASKFGFVKGKFEMSGVVLDLIEEKLNKKFNDFQRGSSCTTS